ncbi:hypothetical protein CS545_04365 [Porphyromonas gingivalis]|nr:hypothetical protein CS545_04365 [Porphyromonas gingivalis]
MAKWSVSSTIHSVAVSRRHIKIRLPVGLGMATPLHEWTEESDVTTRLFEEGTFIPAAKIVGDKSYSIITDYLGTPTEMYNSNGEKTWSAELDIYGSVRNFAERSLSDCPFRYQGQYEDEETGLYYNRFRYYSPDEGRYIS